jgi:nitric oxide reductase NorE protein
MKPVRQLPGEVGIWLFIFGDMLVFSLFFITFMFYRGENLALFQQSQTHLNQTLGVVNTFLMLSSSWFVAMAVQSARKNMGRVTPLLFLCGFGCGLGFVIAKFFEYREKIRAGLTLTSNDFFMYYYMFTGIHLMHVLIGMGVLAFMARYAWSGGFDAKKIGHLESGASFWHVVDLLWIVLFALLYLIK